MQTAKLLAQIRVYIAARLGPLAAENKAADRAEEDKVEAGMDVSVETEEAVETVENEGELGVPLPDGEGGLIVSAPEDEGGGASPAKTIPTSRRLVPMIGLRRKFSLSRTANTILPGTFPSMPDR